MWPLLCKSINSETSKLFNQKEFLDALHRGFKILFFDIS